jgi:hypothetical protein
MACRGMSREVTGCHVTSKGKWGVANPGTVNLKSKKQNLDLLKHSFLKILAFINVRLFRLKMCPKKFVHAYVKKNRKVSLQKHHF